MTAMLASVKNLDEALLVLEAGVDIIDLKQPDQGALGALDITIINDIVKAIGQQRPISAAIGDLPMQPESIFAATLTMAESGVDYVKIGFFPQGDWRGTLNKLLRLTNNYRLIAVFFADQQLDFAWIKQLAKYGFTGVMLDTKTKNEGSLMSTMTLQSIEYFVKLSKQQQLFCGLAGSLKASDIASLLDYQPDYLGFRGALCNAGVRTSALDQKAVTNIKKTLSS